jgi:hypothetical protein
MTELARTLREDLAPALTGEERLKALMAARAARMAHASICEADALEASGARLQSFGEARALRDAIRAGRHDEDEALHAALLAQARILARIAQA